MYRTEQAMTRPSDPECPHCHGAGEVIVSRDPDIDEPCICTDEIEET